ncbi:Ribonuclease H2, subunit C family-containing protein [Strongyloides ratti]|uniref:Ribonuclease H2, subunit C family-containing protein n=1 Tax=Strongyloides ratti TaxID=34506 RepID=A0A090MU34_STRRB|nr:Ribonuclease H2, subunit C family-containing protein [Strongyloides ratti]CEF61958.1 Ribonuclease H2, subunit C family-containing protein [Strongyloides ratti]
MTPSEVYHVFPFKVEYEGPCSWRDYLQIEEKTSENDPSVVKYTTFRGKLLLGRSLKFCKDLIFIYNAEKDVKMPINEIIFWSYFDGEAHHPLKDELLQPMYRNYVDPGSSILKSKKNSTIESKDFITDIANCLTINF